MRRGGWEAEEREEERRRRHRRRGDERGGSGNARLRCTVLELVAGEHLIRRGVDVIVYAASDVCTGLRQGKRGTG